ncbi:MAG: adenylate kinase [Acidimicrobiia bacterium]|nr:adenylate kinase [Acidimicrobiia bacterium]
MRLLFLGPPGAGKGTQAKRVAAHLEIPHIATGDMLRQAVADGTELGLKARSIMERGDLVPDDLVIAMLIDRVNREDATGGFILDGFPRTTAQAEALEERFGGAGLDAAVLIDVDPEEVVRRISGRRVCNNGHVFHIDDAPSGAGELCDQCGEPIYQREDDQAETVRNRLNVYRELTEPLISFYRERELTMHVIEGVGELDEITRLIMDALHS